jgi:ATP-binding cassette subfamily F protein uup
LLVFEPDRQIRSIVGGYSDYQLLRERTAPATAQVPKPSKKAPSKGRPEKPRRFLNREQRELETLPGEIESLESEQESIAAKLADPEVLRNNPAYPAEAQARLQEIEKDLLTKYARWEELETLKAELT